MRVQRNAPLSFPLIAVAATTPQRPRGRGHHVCGDEIDKVDPRELACLERIEFLPEESNRPLASVVSLRQVVRPPGSRRLLHVLPDEDRVPAHRSLTSDSDPEVDVLVRIQTSSPSGSNPLIPGEDPAEYRLEGQIRIAREVSVYEGAKEGTVHNIGVCWAMPAYPRRSPAIASTRDRLED